MELTDIILIIVIVFLLGCLFLLGCWIEAIRSQEPINLWEEKSFINAISVSVVIIFIIFVCLIYLIL